MFPLPPFLPTSSQEMRPQKCYQQTVSLKEHGVSLHYFLLSAVNAGFFNSLYRGVYDHLFSMDNTERDVVLKEKLREVQGEIENATMDIADTLPEAAIDNAAIEWVKSREPVSPFDIMTVFYLVVVVFDKMFQLSACCRLK